MFKCKRLTKPYRSAVKEAGFSNSIKQEKTTAMNSSQARSMSEYPTMMFNYARVGILILATPRYIG